MSRLSLEQFIFETLTSISKGVTRAKEKSQLDNTVPISLSGVGGKDTQLGEQLVQFKVSLEVSEDKSSTVNSEVSGGVISVLSGKIGGQAGSNSDEKSAHTIEFAVPMNFNAVWRHTED